MEPAQSAIVVYTEIISMEEHFSQEYISGSGAEAVFKKTSLGWYANFEGSYELLFMGKDKPTDWFPGDRIKITFTKEPHENPT